MTAHQNEINLLEALHVGSQNLPTQQRKACSFILNNYQQVALMTISTVANKSGLSASTIVRTAASLGYESFQALREALKELLLSSKTTIWWQMELSWNEKKSKNEEEANGLPYTKNDDFWIKDKKKSDHSLVISTKDNIESLTQSLSPFLFESFDKASDLLENAERIFMLGMRSSYGIMRYGYSLFHQFMPNVFMADRSGHEEIFDDLACLVPGDCLLAISSGEPHYAKRTHDIIEAAHSMEIPVILITTELSNPAVPFAEVVLNLAAGKNHYTMAPALTILEALVIEIGRRKKQSAISNLRKLEKLLIEKNITL